MTFRELINKLETIFKGHVFVKDFKCGDVYDINHTDVEYPLICLEPINASVYEGVNKYEFRMFYIDRATEDGSNSIDVISDIMFTMNSIVKDFDNNVEDIEFKTLSNITFFNQNFKDKCTGGYLNISISEYTPYNFCCQ